MINFNFYFSNYIVSTKKCGKLMSVASLLSSNELFNWAFEFEQKKMNHSFLYNTLATKLDFKLFIFNFILFSILIYKLILKKKSFIALMNNITQSSDKIFNFIHYIIAKKQYMQFLLHVCLFMFKCVCIIYVWCVCISLLCVYIYVCIYILFKVCLFSILSLIFYLFLFIYLFYSTKKPANRPRALV